MAKKLFDKDNLFKDCASGATKEGRVPTTPEDRLNVGGAVNRAMGGIMHTALPRPTVSYDKADDEKVVSNGDAYMVFGSDRPGTKASGFGAQGAPSATIDLVVGRMASAFGGEGPREGMQVSPNFAADAARIYISQLTDLDTNFGIATGHLGAERPRSGIGIKADHVRIIGREGVKIVTGGMQGVKGYPPFKGETNSLGGKPESSPRIDLIAGNNTGKRKVWGGIENPIDRIDYLQPIIKGENAVKCLDELSEFIEDLLSLVLNLSIITSLCFAFMGVIKFPLSAITVPAVTLINNFVTSTIFTTRIKKVNWEFNYLNNNAQRYICSRNVSAT
jgi:hypothetical protein